MFVGQEVAVVVYVAVVVVLSVLVVVIVFVAVSVVVIVSVAVAVLVTVAVAVPVEVTVAVVVQDPFGTQMQPLLDISFWILKCHSKTHDVDCPRTSSPSKPLEPLVSQ